MSAQSDRFRVLRRLTEIRFEDELRGYSKNQVDRVLETLSPLAEDVDQLQAKLAEAERRVAAAEAAQMQAEELAATSVRQPVAEAVAAPAEPTAPQAPPEDFDETLRNTLMLAQRTADTVVREASEEAEQLRSSARADALELTATSKEQAASAVAEGSAARDMMLAEVESERLEMLEAATQKANTQIAAIEAELATVHDTQRSELVAQIGELQKIRDLLADDIDNFEGYLADRRETVRSAMSEINAVLDDPARMRPAIPPVLSDIGEVDPQVYEPIKVDLESLHQIEDSGQAATDSAPIDLDQDDSSASSPFDVAPGEDPTAAGPATQAIPVVDLSDQTQARVDQTGATGSPGEPVVPVTDPWSENNLNQSPGSVLVESEPATKVTAGSANAEEPTTGSDLGDDADALDDSKPAADANAASERPAWAEAVPEDPTQDVTDPFLEELRKATDNDADADEALSRFLDEDGDDSSRGGWFGRRR